LQQFQRSDYNEVVINKNTSQRNRFGVAFSTAKTAVNIALETNSDVELIKLLKEFIAAKRERDDGVNEEGNITEINDDANNIVPLQRHLISQITNPNVTKIRGAPSKKRIKGATEASRRRVPMQEILNEDNNQNAPAKQQRRCLQCGKFGHYKKKCPSG
jgi:hypothetical protein